MVSSIGGLSILAIFIKFKRISGINCLLVPVVWRLRIYPIFGPGQKFSKTVLQRCKSPGSAMFFLLGHALIAVILLLTDKNALRFIGGCKAVLSHLVSFQGFVVVSFHMGLRYAYFSC
jgi:hypothetical protein